MDQLTGDAHYLLCTELEKRGNVLAETHRDALWSLLETFTNYVAGTDSGRQAFALPTGMGKTSAVAAFIATLWARDIQASVAVAASKVEELCSLKRELVRLGVPADMIGLKHTVDSASEPSTGNASFPYQLVTHARVRLRGGRDFDLFARHDGQDRALMIYDETLFRSDVLSVDAHLIKRAVSDLGLMAERVSSGSVSKLAHAYLAECADILLARIEHLRQTKPLGSKQFSIQLPFREPSEIAAYTEAVSSNRVAPFAEILGNVLSISQDSLGIIATSNIDGAVWHHEAVPPDLRNIVILDASTPIRDLIEYDSTIREPRDMFDSQSLKSYADVKVVQIEAGGGRSTIEESAKSIKKEKSALAREVVALVREQWDTASGILLFTYKTKSLDIASQLRDELDAAGFDTDAELPSGKRRLEFLTFGEETGLNGFEHCDAVIMAGVLQRSRLDMAANIIGQSLDRTTPTPHDVVDGIVESEVAHVIYQGASRGSCRRIVNSKAQPMSLYFIHRRRDIKDRLDKVMPGAVWEFRRPTYLKAAQREGVTRELTARLLGHLRALPSTTNKVPTRGLKAALGVAPDAATQELFRMAVREIDKSSTCGWARSGHAMVRRDGAFRGFKDETQSPYTAL